MPDIIKLSINVTKIDKEKLYKGKKGTYLDAVLIPTPNNQYGNDYMIVQEVTKEEREAGKKGEILGNAKFLKKRDESDNGDGAPLPEEPGETIMEDEPPF